nr:MAG TPA: hypothetical protein [Caudoviricetes sp.]
MSYINNPPKNKNGVVPTENGWKDAKTGELLVSVKINPDLIKKWRQENTPQPIITKPNIQNDTPKEIENESVAEDTVKKTIKKSTSVKRKRIV